MNNLKYNTTRTDRIVLATSILSSPIICYLAYLIIPIVFKNQ